MCLWGENGTIQKWLLIGAGFWGDENVLKWIVVKLHIFSEMQKPIEMYPTRWISWYMHLSQSWKGPISELVGLSGHLLTRLSDCSHSSLLFQQMDLSLWVSDAPKSLGTSGGQHGPRLRSRAQVRRRQSWDESCPRRPLYLKWTGLLQRSHSTNSQPGASFPSQNGLVLSAGGQVLLTGTPTTGKLRSFSRLWATPQPNTVPTGTCLHDNYFSLF